VPLLRLEALQSVLGLRHPLDTFLAASSRLRIGTAYEGVHLLCLIDDFFDVPVFQFVLRGHWSAARGDGAIP